MRLVGRRARWERSCPSVFPKVQEFVVWAFHAAVKHNYAVAIQDLVPLIVFGILLRPFMKFRMRRV